MKALIEGVWHSPVTDEAADEAARARQPADTFRHRVSADGESGFPAEAETVKLDHVRRHYYDDPGLVDPAIVPAGPQVDFQSPA